MTMKWIDRVLLAATGIGAMVMMVNHFRPKPETTQQFFCPHCRSYLETTESGFALHVSDELWGRRRRA